MAQRGQADAEVVVVGHVCLDIIPALGDAGAVAFEPGALIEVGDAALSTGGVVSNTGLTLHRLGVATRLVCKVGDDLFGRAIRERLASQGPALAEAVVTDPRAATSYSVVVSPPGVDRMFLHCPGANAAFGADDVTDDALRGARVMHFGYPPLMPMFYRDGGRAMRRLFDRAHAAGAATSLDLCAIDPKSEAGTIDWLAWLARVLPAVDVFAPSLDEALAIVGGPGALTAEATSGEAAADPALVRALAERFLGMGAAVVALKLGDRGLYVRGSSDAARLAAAPGLGLAPGWVDAAAHQPCFKVDVAGTTGSGDATIGGLLAALLRGEGPAGAARAACAVGACCVEAADAVSGIQPWPAVERRIAAGWPVVDGPARDVKTLKS